MKVRQAARAWARGALLVAGLAAAAVAPSAAEADDPLDDVDGMEGWDDIDTSAVDEATAWRWWAEELARWEAGRARLEAERVRMEEIRSRDGEGDTQEGDLSLPPPEQELQERIDAARRITQTGGPEFRDEEGQALDDERPWSRR